MEVKHSTLGTRAPIHSTSAEQCIAASILCESVRQYGIIGLPVYPLKSTASISSATIAFIKRIGACHVFREMNSEDEVFASAMEIVKSKCSDICHVSIPTMDNGMFLNSCTERLPAVELVK